jgi:8-oxo-dGTP diphosphatase
MPDRTRYEVNVCVLLHRAGRWLLSVRSADVDYAPGQVGLIGGHVEPTLGPDVLENTARREVLEETGLDLSDTALSYLGSELYRGAAGQPVLTVTFVGELSEGAEPEVADRAELTAVGWWTPDELAAADVPPWILPLVRAAAHLTR